MRFWRIFGAIAAVALYAAAVSGSFYEATTPVSLPAHVLLRKIYAVLAFALLGFAFQRARLPRAGGVGAATIAIAIYSYAIELGQIVIAKAEETFAEHAFDVASGGVGGALGAFLALALARGLGPRRQREAVFIALALIALAWGFSVTYGRRGR